MNFIIYTSEIRWSVFSKALEKFDGVFGCVAEM